MKPFKAATFQLSVLAIAVMLVLAGCSNNNAKSEPSASAESSKTSQPPDGKGEGELPPVELTWYYGTGQQQPDQQVVEDAVNKYLKDNTRLNATVKLKPIDFGSYDQKLNVAIASNDPMDIVWTTQSWLLKYQENIKKGAFLALDDLLPQYAPKVFNEVMPQKYWDDVRADTDGKIYAVPSYQLAAKAFGFVFQKRFVDKYGFDISTVKTEADLEPFLETLKKNEPGMIPFAFRPEDNGIADPDLRDYAGYITYNKNDPFKALNYYETPQYKAFLDLMHSWYQKGYIYQDSATVKDWNEFFRKGNVAVTTDVTSKPGADAEFPAANGGHETVSRTITSPIFYGVTATMNAISSKSKNPERAMMFLELVNTDQELYRLLSYGLKGKHYEDQDGYYKKADNSAYAPDIFWVFGNPNLSLLSPGQPKDLFDQIREYNEAAEVPPMTGFHFDDSNLKTEMAAVNAVKGEYIIPLQTGTADPNVVLPKFLEALKKAGYDKILAELNKQLAEWADKNGKK